MHTRSSVLSIGLFCYDHLVVVPELASVSDGALVHEVDVQGGGVAATAAVAAKRLGANAALWARVGDDPFGHFLLNSLRKHGLTPDTVSVVPGGHTAVSTVLVDEHDGERRFLYRPATGLSVLPDKAPPVLPEGLDALLIDGRWMPLCLDMARQACERGIPVISDIGHARPDQRDLLRYVTHPVFSELAMAEFTEYETEAEFVSSLLRRRAEIVIVTRGERGLSLWTEGTRSDMSAFSVDVVDTTGAGDCFHGAFAVALAENRTPRSAAEFASAAAALACMKLGGQSSCPDRESVRQFLKQNNAEWCGEHLSEE